MVMEARIPRSVKAKKLNQRGTPTIPGRPHLRKWSAIGLIISRAVAGADGVLWEGESDDLTRVPSTRH